jgi:FAD/FMN-containing dehydrogenase
VNFGIVTSFTYETIPLPNPAGLWDANKFYSFDKVPELVQAWHTVQTESLPKDLDIGGFNVYAYVQPYEGWFVIDRYVHTVHTDASSWPEIFAPFEKIDAVPDTTHISVQPYSNITAELAAASPHGKRNVYATFTHFPSVELTTKLVEIFQEEVAPIKAVEDLLPCLVLQPLAQNSVTLMSKNGGNALGLKSSDGTLVILSISWSWKSAADDAVVYAAYHKFFERAEAVAKEMGLWHRYKYANYAQASQDVWAGYGEESVERLRKVQREVDPKGVFAKGGLGGAGFKLNVKEVVAEGGAAEKEKVTDRKSEL